MARDHRERNKREVDDGRRDNCGNLISVRVHLLLAVVNCVGTVIRPVVDKRLLRNGYFSG